jgi:transposase-like protein
MIQIKPYTTYTKEFKQEAVRMMETSDRPAAEIAMELGIRHRYLRVRSQLFLIYAITVI